MIPDKNNRLTGGYHCGTAALVLVFITLLLMPCQSDASWNLSVDADARSGWGSQKGISAEIHALGLSIRKSFADNSGDRFIISGLFEAEKNLSEIMIHELYLRYKGPMGIWNVTAGRIGIPYGLLTSFSTSRHIFENPLEQLIGFDADNGIMLSGIAGIFDYGISFSQGYGVHRIPMFPGEGFGAGRIGVTLGEAEEYSIGISFCGGRTLSDHIYHSPKTRITGGMDVTLNIGQTVIRTEVDAGTIDNQRVVAGYGLIDYTLHPRLDLSAGLRLRNSHHLTSGGIFAGFSFKLPWFNFRGGYVYELSDRQMHNISLQLYRIFSFTF